MKRYTPEELAEVLRLHKLWLNDEEGGERADLRGSDLSGSDLRCSDLRDSDLRCSDLSGSDLRCSDLRCSDLSGSNLRGSDLRGSDLSGSDLSGSDLSGSDLSGSKGFVWFVEVGPIGSRNDRTRYTPTTGLVVCGCFRGSLDEFEAAVLKTHVGGTEYRWQYLAAIAMFRALEAEKAVMWGVEPKVIPESGGHIESADCWCGPTVEEHPDRTLIIHNQTH